MANILGLHHVALKIREDEYEKTMTFYRDVLGMKLLRTWGNCCMLDLGNTILEIVGNSDGSDIGGSRNHFAILTDDVDSMIEKVRSEGYKITIEPKDANLGGDYPVRLGFFIGPANETVEFFSLKQEA